MLKKKILLILALIVFVMGSMFTISSATAYNSANFELVYTNSSYGNVFSQTRDIFVSGAGYDVSVTEVSGTSTLKAVTITCPYATGVPVQLSSTGTYHIGYAAPLPWANYVTFTFTLNYNSGGTAHIKGTISKR
jgi:uncharacterized protein YxeA